MKKIYLVLVVTLSLGFTINAAAQIPNYLPKTGLIAWYPFNGNAKDESGSGNDLTVDSAVLSKDRFGKSNAAYYFDGIKDCLYRDALTNFSDFSLSVWVNMKAYPPVKGMDSEGASFVSNGYGRTNGTGLKYGANSVDIITFGNQFNSTLSTFKPDTNIWYHYVCTKFNDTYSLYVDGKLSSTADCLTNKPKGFFVVGAVRGDISDNKFSVFFNGQIDDIGFWNRSLTEIEVKNLYSNSVVGVEESSTSNLYSIFPNPAQNQITIQIPNDSKETRYSISNCLGNSILTGELSYGKTTIDVSNLSDGLYLIQIGVGRQQSFTFIKY